MCDVSSSVSALSLSLSPPRFIGGMIRFGERGEEREREGEREEVEQSGRQERDRCNFCVCFSHSKQFLPPLAFAAGREPCMYGSRVGFSWKRNFHPGFFGRRSLRLALKKAI